MVFWVVTSSRDLMGPYTTASKAQQVLDGLDDGHASVRTTESDKRAVAVQELRHQDVEREGLTAGHKNYKHSER